jgi:hypothetical protein
MGVAGGTTTRITPGLFWRVETLGRTVLMGLATGAVIGGIGGRLAMLVLRLTSDPNLHGLQTDDDFTIGVVSSATLFLVGVTAVLGAFGAVAYLIVRAWLPERVRPWIVAGLAGVIGGAEAIRPGGIDFTRLEPLSLAVAMFVALPFMYGYAMSRFVDRSLSRSTGRPPVRAWIAAGLFPILLAFIGQLGLLGAGVLLVFLVAPLPPVLAALWSSAVVRWAGRAALVAAAAWWTAALASDVTEVL